ncbi:MAG TPA: cobalamin-binding domain-containing protein [Candidatus Wunengus sp. YC64]|uniref:cobalamin-binding domain-containing protein n=1 Tax=Candidatus Wunengus sp. YC64 TaxID=3367700 RepID=UPI0040283FAD
MNILLVEPPYKNKYPPLGLMKISAFHKERGDEVHFVKGLNKQIRSQIWDRIYITTLFSFYWDKTIETIKYYEFSVKDPQNLFIGGPMATILADEIENATGFKPVKGLLNQKGKVRFPNDHLIDGLVPDYSMLEQIDYKYPASNAYFAYMTRGCVRRCPFCVVYVIEPEYVPYIPLKKQVALTTEKFGEKKDLLLLDNNVLASAEFDKIINEIKDIGFHKGARLNGRFRYVDFNQGIDLRLLTKDKMKKLAEIPIKPLRIAFDRFSLKEKYVKALRLAAECGIKYLSNYILFNYDDSPDEFYQRLRINIDLNEEFERAGYSTRIWSFPMKYSPILGEHGKDRKFVGKNWNPRYLRSIQCILNATHGVVGPKRKFFEAAFGKNKNEFKKLLLMPDNYIIYREDHKKNGAADWNNLYNTLSSKQKEEFRSFVYSNRFDSDICSKYPEVNKLLSHY